MAASPDNPLLRPPSLPNDAIPFLDIKPEHFLPAVQARIAEVMQKIREIKENGAAAGFENTIEALEFSNSALTFLVNTFTVIAGVCNSDLMMEVEAQVSEALAEHHSAVMADQELFLRVRAVYDARDGLGLSGEQRMLLENTYYEFVGSGALLDAKARAELGEIEKALAGLTALFQNNLVKATGDYKKIIDDESELAGLPQRVKAMFREAAEKNGYPGKWLISLSPPPDIILDYCDNRPLRREIQQAFNSLAYGGACDNRSVILDIIWLRHRKAQILGYANYAELALEERMAGDPATVMKFLKETGDVYKVFAERHLKQVQDFALKTDGLAKVEPWDFRYYNRKLQEEKFSVDMEDLRSYFEMDRVFRGVCDHVEKLFDVEIRESPGKYPVYHPDVKAYEVSDRKTGALLGLLYTDYYARPGDKNGGAWMEAFRERGVVDGQDKCPIVINVCNFAKGADGQPTLLSFDDVVTLFHELGHGLHALLAQGRYASQNGTNVTWDFIELPSQLQENWVRSKEVLAAFARHYKTGKPLPAGMIEKVLELDKFNAAINGMRMNFWSQLDMKWHMTDPDSIDSVESLEDSVVAEHALFPRFAGSESTCFDHLFAEDTYAAGFYSYKWAAVLEADIFEEFMKKGLYDRETANRLRSTIYAKGGTVDPFDLMVMMLGREADAEALFRREGLVPPKDESGAKKDKKILPPKP